MIARTQRGDKLVVMGDFNARVGNNVLRWSDVMVKMWRMIVGKGF